MERYNDEMGEVTVYNSKTGQVIIKGSVASKAEMGDLDMLIVECADTGKKLCAWNGEGSIYNWEVCT